MNCTQESGEGKNLCSFCSMGTYGGSNYLKEFVNTSFACVEEAVKSSKIVGVYLQKPVYPFTLCFDLLPFPISHRAYVGCLLIDLSHRLQTDSSADKKKMKKYVEHLKGSLSIHGTAENSINGKLRMHFTSRCIDKILDFFNE